MQYGLRGMFWIVACLCSFFAVMASMEVATSAAALLFLVLIGAHVGGNAIGTRRRDLTTASLLEDPRSLKSGRDHPSRGVAGVSVPTTTGLQERRPMGRVMHLTAVAGAIGGAVFGGLVLADRLWDSITVPGLVLGSLSSAILGAQFGFLASCLGSVARGAWRDAAQRCG